MGNTLDSIPRVAREKFRDNELTELEEQFEKLATTKLADGTSGQGSHIPLEVFQRRFLANEPDLSKRLFKAFDFDNDGKLNQFDFFTGMANCRSPADVREKLIYKMFEEKPGHAKLRVLQRAFSDALVEPASSETPKKEVTARGEWDYPKQSEKEISFKAGEYFKVLIDIDATWLWVRNSEGQEGYVPKAFIRLFEVEATSPRPSEPEFNKDKLSGIDSLIPNAEGDITVDQFLIAAKSTPKIRKLSEELIRFDTRAPSDQQITGPTDFKHHTHVGFNPKTGGFDVANLPEEWKLLFKAANISDSELADPTTAAMIVNLLSHEQAKGGHSTQPVGDVDSDWHKVESGMGPAPTPPKSSSNVVPPVVVVGEPTNVNQKTASPAASPRPLPTPSPRSEGGAGDRASGARPLPRLPNGDAPNRSASRPLPLPRSASDAKSPRDLAGEKSPRRPSEVLPAPIPSLTRGSTPPPVPPRSTDATAAPPPLPQRKTSSSIEPQKPIKQPPAPPPLSNSGGAPPPPPPPPAASTSPRGHPSSAPGHPAPPRGNDDLRPSASVAGLLGDIRKGKSLKKVDPNEIKLTEMTEGDVTNLADVLRKAMVVRRQDIADLETADGDKIDGDDDWK